MLMMIMGPFDWAHSLRNSLVFHLAGAVNPMGKLSDCQQLGSESTHPKMPNELITDLDDVFIDSVQVIVGDMSLVTHCKMCDRVLPEQDYITDDNSNASVCCDGKNCNCNVWYCWPCAGYDEVSGNQ